MNKTISLYSIYIVNSVVQNELKMFFVRIQNSHSLLYKELQHDALQV